MAMRGKDGPNADKTTKSGAKTSRRRAEVGCSNGLPAGYWSAWRGPWGQNCFQVTCVTSVAYGTVVRELDRWASTRKR